jgi:ABC-type antimicrobial peptide transport system permease subunit
VILAYILAGAFSLLITNILPDSQNVGAIIQIDTGYVLIVVGVAILLGGLAAFAPARRAAAITPIDTIRGQ